MVDWDFVRLQENGRLVYVSMLEDYIYNIWVRVISCVVLGKRQMCLDYNDFVVFYIDGLDVVVDVMDVVYVLSFVR